MKKKRGFTLTELMITVTILVIAGGPIIYMFISSSRGTNMEKDHFQAIYLTQGLVEEYLADVYENPKVVLSEGTFPEPYEKFRYSTEYKPVKDEDQLYLVTVATRWPSKIRDGEYKLSFYISKRYYLDIEEKIHTAWDEEYGEMAF